MPYLECVEGWRVRPCPLKAVTLCLLLSLWLLITSIISHHWAVWTTEGDGSGREIPVGLFTYITTDVPAPPDTAPILYAILAVIALIVLMCDVIIDFLFVARNFYLVIPTLIVFSFIAGCMTAIVVVLWFIAHTHDFLHVRFAWSFYLAAISCGLDLLSSLLCIAEFKKRGREPLRLWSNSYERVATLQLEREASAPHQDSIHEEDVIELDVLHASHDHARNHTENDRAELDVIYTLTNETVHEGLPYKDSQLETPRVGEDNEHTVNKEAESESVGAADTHIKQMGSVGDIAINHIDSHGVQQGSSMQ